MPLGWGHAHSPLRARRRVELVRVALTKGTLLVPPTYFALSHALAMPQLDWRAFTLAARIADPAVTLPIVEAAPRALGGSLPLRVAAQARGLGRMYRAISAWGPDVIHQQQATWSLPAVRAARESAVSRSVYGCAVSITAAAGRENTSFTPSCHILVILSHSVPEIPLSA